LQSKQNKPELLSNTPNSSYLWFKTPTPQNLTAVSSQNGNQAQVTEPSS